MFSCWELYYIYAIFPVHVDSQPSFQYINFWLIASNQVEYKSDRLNISLWTPEIKLANEFFFWIL